MYHKVARPGPEAKIRGHYVTPDQFGRHLRLLDLMRIPAASIDDLDLQKNGRAVAITFDDGYANFATEAWPRLQAARRPATVFVVTERLGRTDEWDEVSEPLMTANQIRECVRRGTQIGSHTATHANLTKVSLAEAESEIRRSAEQLAALEIGPTPGFCYPYGAESAEIRKLVAQSGYDYACTTQKGQNHATTDRYGLRRINVRADTGVAVLAYKLLRYRSDAN
jgi:peptidoglycan/xylan/chitin deacetylase (PgdA/CDA1 family)